MFGVIICVYCDLIGLYMLDKLTKSKNPIFLMGNVGLHRYDIAIISFNCPCPSSYLKIFLKAGKCFGSN